VTLDELIHRLSLEPLSQPELEKVAGELKLSLRPLCDAIARKLGEGYLIGTYSWELGDAAMNNLFSAAYVNADFGLSEFACGVFSAFDEGEYIHRGEPPELDGEPRTRVILNAIFSRL
jgi:hypothetical protein